MFGNDHPCQARNITCLIPGIKRATNVLVSLNSKLSDSTDMCDNAVTIDHPSDIHFGLGWETPNIGFCIIRDLWWHNINWLSQTLRVYAKVAVNAKDGMHLSENQTLWDLNWVSQGQRCLWKSTPYFQVCGIWHFWSVVWWVGEYTPKNRLLNFIDLGAFQKS